MFKLLRQSVPTSTLLVLLALPVAGCPDTHETLDAAASPDTRSDAAGDAGAYVFSCEPMRAALNPCAPPCRAVRGAFWDGGRCVPYCDECVGPDCGVYATVEACESAHASCDAALCTQTSGDWFNVPALCGNHVCGVTNAASCLVPTRGCNCGTGRNFQAGVGCVVDAACPLVDPVDDEEATCIGTGGTWDESHCGHYDCGRESLLDCVDPGCDCGPFGSFDGALGCILRGACQTRRLGELCEGESVCGEGVCCSVGGDSGEMQCTAPMCESPSGLCGPARP